jgi:hypothetical protein
MPDRRQERVEGVEVLGQVVVHPFMLIGDGAADPERRQGGKKHPGQLLVHDFP